MQLLRLADSPNQVFIGADFSYLNQIIDLVSVEGGGGRDRGREGGSEGEKEREREREREGGGGVKNILVHK